MLNLPKWNITELTGYVPKTTFWSDFSIADRFGAYAIVDTYTRAFNEWKNDVIYLTELVMVLNHKCWSFYDQNKNDLSQLYSSLYYKTHDWALDNLKGEDLEYYIRTTDQKLIELRGGCD